MNSEHLAPRNFSRDELFSSADLAQLLGISEEAVENLIFAHDIKPVVVPFKNLPHSALYGKVILNRLRRELRNETFAGVVR